MRKSIIAGLFGKSYGQSDGFSAGYQKKQGNRLQAIPQNNRVCVGSANEPYLIYETSAE